jgi:hypothetical protein
VNGPWPDPSLVTISSLLLNLKPLGPSPALK